MNNLIKALQIFLKYEKGKKLLFCEHNTFMVFVDPAGVPESEIKELELLGFKADHVSGIFESPLQ